MTDHDRLHQPTLPYQDTLDEFRPWESLDAMALYRSFLMKEWWWLYRDMLEACGYEDDGERTSHVWGTFEYASDAAAVIDDPEQDERWWAENRSNYRLVAAHGLSSPVDVPREAKRINYHKDILVHEFGPKRTSFAWDKGHFIAHTIGGQVDGGLFAQRTDVNRGWSELGKMYRAMERWAQQHPGTLVFSRPIYHDGSEHPFYFEYGVLREQQWWVEIFPNRYAYEPFRGYEHAPIWRRKRILPTHWDAKWRIDP